MMNPDETRGRAPAGPDEERPPVFGTWATWYGVILAELVLLVVIFRIITVVFG